jgi:ABC-2 type transport system ATP-binding protein
MPEAAISFSHVFKSYGAKAALRDVTLGVGAGELFGLVGVNGAGKTTLLKCLLDFCESDSGSIEIFGVTHRLTRARKPLAFLPENFVPPYYLTGRDFLEYMLTLQSLHYDAAAAQQMFAALDLDLSALSLPVRAFSKGMTQKLGLAACLLARKQLCVLDEPTSGLDPKARALLKQQLRKIGEQGRTVFLTSHALADVDEICDRMAVLHAGRVLFVGTPQQLRAQQQAADLEQAFLRCIEAQAGA